MRIVLQRVSQASVTINDEVTGQINRGFVILVGVEDADTMEDVDYLTRKIAGMRIFEDEAGKMNHSLDQVGGEILSVSQFTLHASTRKGNRPSFTQAGDPDHAEQLYDALNDRLRKEGLTVATGEFGADMAVDLTNDGPVTIIIDSQAKDF